MKRILFTLFLAVIFSAAQSQNTVGLISFDAEQAQDGYNLFFPHNQSNVFLLDNCGKLVKVWEDSVYRPGNSVYLSEDGLLYKAKGRGGLSNEWIHAGGGGEILEIRNFENDLIWQWAYNDSTVRLHHDFAVMPNGNILAIAWDRYSQEEAFQAGRDTMNLAEGELWPDHIIEVQPIYPDSAAIVWEWHSWDHMVQEFDSEKDNFGVVADHPELIDINFTVEGEADWHHMNAIDYNPFFDQIVVSVPTFNEMWIIDHSTTTEQSASHSGGLSGKGGDLLFRWGNPQAYQAGDSDDQQLFFNHDVHWLDIELSPSDPDFGKIGFFNNQVGEDYSTVGIIAPDFDSYKLGFVMEDGQFLPQEMSWEYQRPDSTAMFSTGLSSFQRLPNGNSLICVGRFGYTFEITPDEEIVWEYKNPMLAGLSVPQGTELAINNNIQFRMTRYSSEYPGFEGVELDSLGFIELDPNLDYVCPLDTIVSVSEINLNQIAAYPNPTSQYLTISVQQDWGVIKSIEVFDLQGRNVISLPTVNEGFIIQLDLSELSDGMYIFQARSDKGYLVSRSFVKE